MIDHALRTQLRAWLAEDVGHGDVTTLACVPAELRLAGRFTA